MYTDGNEVLALQEDKQYRCILWKDGCSMYDARPVQCSTYPWWDWLCGSKEMWQECGRTCPGIGSQKMWTKEQIEEQIKLNSNNQPLRKDFFYFQLPVMNQPGKINKWSVCQCCDYKDNVA